MWQAADSHEDRLSWPDGVTSSARPTGSDSPPIAIQASFRSNLHSAGIAPIHNCVCLDVFAVCATDCSAPRVTYRDRMCCKWQGHNKGAMQCFCPTPLFMRVPAMLQAAGNARKLAFATRPVAAQRRRSRATPIHPHTLRRRRLIE
jgi:hypothetical protein